jgi:hypothetical protein
LKFIDVTKKDLPNLNLGGISAYYKSDHPEDGGFNFGLDCGPGLKTKHNLDVFAKNIEIFYKAFKAAPKAEQAEYLSHEDANYSTAWTELAAAGEIMRRITVGDDYDPKQLTRADIEVMEKAVYAIYILETRVCWSAMKSTV